MLGDVDNGTSHSQRKMRASTIQQRFGFVDADLKTPLHDDIVIWLDEQMDVILNAAFGRRMWTPKHVEALRKRAEDAVLAEYAVLEDHPAEAGWSREALDKWLPMPAPPPWQIGDIKKVWEYAIVDRSFTVGFVDMCVTFTRPSDLQLKGIERRSVKVGVEMKPFTAGGKPYECPIYEQITGLRSAPEWTIERERRAACFEVKTTIPSLGEAIRQIRMYQTYEKSPFFIVSPDIRFAEQFKGQNIGFIEYPSGRVF